MRKDSRTVLMGFLLFLQGTGFAAAQGENPKDTSVSGSEMVRLTLEISWGSPGDATKDAAAGGADNNRQGAGDALFFEVSAGRVLDAIGLPAENGRSEHNGGVAAADVGSGPGPNGSWRLGTQSRGRLRARVEAPLDASVIVRGGDQIRVTLPLLAILEKPQHTPGQSPLVVSVERLPWDSLNVDFGEAAREGIFAPGSEIPVSVGFNILWPESPEVAVRTTASVRSIRGGDVLVRYEPRDRDVVATNRRETAVRAWGIKAPRAEGTYVLEISASWLSVGTRESSVLSRFIRRRRPAVVPNSAVRRVVFTVLDPVSTQAAAGHESRESETEVDTIDLTRSRSYRPLAAGRSPAADPGRSAWAVPAEALIEPSRRDRLLGWIMRTGAEASKLDPTNPSGLAWSAMVLKVTHPERPHRLTIKVRGGEPAALGVGLIEPGNPASGSAPRLVLDACASGPPILEDGPAAPFSWLVWPRANEMVLVLINRSRDAEVRLGTVSLNEINGLPAAPVASTVNPSSARMFGVYLSGARPLEPFGGSDAETDPLTTAQNLIRYLGYCGATAAVVPERLADRSSRRALDGQADENSTGPDQLQLVRRLMERQKFSIWLELDFDGPEALPGLPAPNSLDAARRGLVRVDREGKPSDSVYNPLNPDVREAMKRKVTQALAQFRGHPSDASIKPGILIRLGPGPTLLGTPDTGLDDLTFDRFVRESFSAETARRVPGSSETDPDRFTVRSRYLAGVGRMPWLTWRSKAIATLYTDLAEAAREALPGVVLAVVTPGLDDGPAGLEARRVDRAGLAPSQAWRSVGLDLQAWPTIGNAPPIFRGVVLSADALGRDLATSPDLDALVAARPQRGLLLSIQEDSALNASANAQIDEPAGTSVPTQASAESSRPARLSANVTPKSQSSDGSNQAIWMSAMPTGDCLNADELLGHAIAAYDAHWVFLADRTVFGHEDKIRRFSSVLRALPAWAAVPPSAVTEPASKPFGVTVRRMADQAQTYLEFTNDSPYPIRLAALVDAPAAAPIDDLGRNLRLSPLVERGGRNLVLDLLPYGVSAIRVGAPRVELSAITPYPSEPVMASMQARFNELSTQLARLNHGLATRAAVPPNASFEPGNEPDANAPPADKRADAELSGPNSTGPAGWKIDSKVASAGSIAIDADHPQQGQGSLRLTTKTAPASVVSEVFVPDVQSSLEIQVYFRAAVPGAKVRVWVEGESAGKPYVRRTELSVSTAWEPRAVRASDIPAAGLEQARLRFEMLTPGTLWIDDLQIRGETSSRPARLNAQRTLLAALQAYREQRYADFARLAGSHWIRQSIMPPAGRLARSEDVSTGTQARTKR